MYMTASVLAVILESTMNFKLFAKRKEIDRRGTERINGPKYEGGPFLFKITTHTNDNHLDIIIHQLAVRCFHGGLCIYSN